MEMKLKGIRLVAVIAATVAGCWRVEAYRNEQRAILQKLMSGQDAPLIALYT